LISEGFLNKEIASKINLSIDSVKKITQHVYEKLEVRNRSEAVNKYLSYRN
jgi:DNA-binding NarL/FixJ family response regulator